MVTKFGLCSVWTGNGGDFDFNGSLQTLDGVTAQNVSAVYTGLKSLADATAQSAFPSDTTARTAYALALFEHLIKSLSIQTVGGLKTYLMLNAIDGNLLYENGTILHQSDKSTDVLVDYRTAIIWAMQTTQSLLGTNYGVIVFKDLLLKIRVGG